MKNKVSKLVISMLITSFAMPTLAEARAKKKTAMFSKARQMHRQKTASNFVVKNNKPTLQATVTKPTINSAVSEQVTINDKTNVSNTNNTKKEYKIADDRIAKLKLLVADVNKAKENVVAMCGGISTNISKIKALSATSAVSSAIGTGLSAGALATGIMKTKQEEEEQAEIERLRQAELDKRARESIERRERMEQEREQERQRIRAEQEQERIAEQKRQAEEEKQQIEEQQEIEVKQITEQNQIAKGEQTRDEKTPQDNVEVKKEDKKEEQEKKKQKPREMQEERKIIQKQEQKERNDMYDKILSSVEEKLAEKDLTEHQRSVLEGLKETVEGHKEWHKDVVPKIRRYQLDQPYTEEDTDIDTILDYDEQIREQKEWETNMLRDLIRNRNEVTGFKLYSPLLAPEKLGHIRTGLMAGATATSAISMGTSAGASVDSKKLYEKMEGCNNAIAELKKVNGILVAEVLDIEADLKANDVTENPDYVKDAEQVNKTAKNIVKGCNKYETKDIKLIKNLMTASSVISGIGTATALTGAVTSGLANTGKGKLYSSELDLTANIMAGVTTGTSVTTTGLSATAAAKLGKKLMEQAKECEKTF